MAHFLFFILVTSLLAVAHSSVPNAGFKLQPFRVELSRKVPQMLHKIRETRILNKEEYASVGRSAGIDVETLKQLRHQWLYEFDWDKEQAYLNT
jgi:hypothetical protein